MGVIEYKDVNFAYPNGFSAVEGVGFSIEKGERTAIIGQNGAGKTTTVKMMNGLLKPSKGTVIINGKDTKDYTTAKLSRETGYVFQNPEDQIFHNTVKEEIEFGPGVLGFDSSKIKEMTDWAVSLCGLGDDLEKNPYDLPLSIRKFVTIASVLAMDTDIIVLDEPTAGQDLNGIRCLVGILDELRDKGKTVVTITHDMEFVVDNFRDIMVMAHKNLLRRGTPEEIFEDDGLLKESMLKKPYISGLVESLGIKEDIVSAEALADYMARRAGKAQVSTG